MVSMSDRSSTMPTLAHQPSRRVVGRLEAVVDQQVLRGLRVLAAVGALFVSDENGFSHPSGRPWPRDSSPSWRARRACRSPRGERGHRRRQHAELSVVLRSAQRQRSRPPEMADRRGPRNGRRGDAVGEGQRVDGLQGEAIDRGTHRASSPDRPSCWRSGARPVIPLLKYLTVRSVIGNSCEKGSKIRGHPHHQGVSTSPRISNVKWSSGTDSGPCWTVRTTRPGTGCRWC